MRKRSKYKPRPVHCNAFAIAVEGVTPISEVNRDYFTRMLLKNHGAMQMLTQGGATKKDMDTLMAMTNIMDALCRLDVCAPLADEVEAGRQALISICNRAVKHLRFVATGAEIQALNIMIDLHDQLMPHVTGAQLDKALDLAQKTVRKGMATVLQIDESLLEEATV